MNAVPEDRSCTSSTSMNTSEPQSTVCDDDKIEDSSDGHKIRPSYDGYNWRKYGQKQLTGSEYPRSYYKCTYPNCPVKKKVERSFNGQIAEIVYKGQHNHQKPQPPKRNTSGTQGQPSKSSNNINERNEELSTHSIDPNRVDDADCEEGSKITAVDDEPKRKRSENRGENIQGRNIVVATNAGSIIPDDGWPWRKYGQKEILGSKFPRSYYRCPHNSSVGCLATKTVERLSDDPPSYSVVYKEPHSCQTAIKTPPITHNSFSPASQSLSPDILEFDLSTQLDKVTNFDSPQSSSLHYPAPSLSPFEEFSFQQMEDMFEPIKDELEDRIMMEMRGCFSVFFLLPHDHEFEEDSLIQLWMAGEDTMEEHTGHSRFRLLLNEGYVTHSGIDYLTKRSRYKLNSQELKTLLDGQDGDRNSCLKWESEQKNSDTTITNEIQHVSMLCDRINATVFQTLEQLHELRTLLFLPDYGNKVLQIPDSMFRSLKKLRALDLSGTHIRKLSSFVGCMIHLRYLDLSRTLLEWLPETICSLYELQTLNLRGCHKLRGLPRQLKRLTKLRHLDVDVVGKLAPIIPRGIGSLVNLRTLSGFLVGDEDGCKIQELKKLNSITGDFCISMLENIGHADEAKEAALMKKRLLNKLQLRWTASQSSATDNNFYDVLENLQPYWNLKELQIFCYEGPTFPNWVGNPRFNQLVSLTFFRCVNVTELPLVERLPCLKHLELVKMNGIKEIGGRGESDYAAFFKLEKLEINEMQSLETWRWENANEGDYKSLVELTINDCPELRELHVLSSLCSIKHLEIKECSKLESLSDTKLPDSLENLIVEDCPRIKKKCLQQGGEDWYKVQHVSNIRVCTDDDDEDDDDNGE